MALASPLTPTRLPPPPPWDCGRAADPINSPAVRAADRIVGNFIQCLRLLPLQFIVFAMAPEVPGEWSRFSEARIYQTRAPYRVKRHRWPLGNTVAHQPR